jgi:hypothetical protein
VTDNLATAGAEKGGDGGEKSAFHKRNNAAKRIRQIPYRRLVTDA